MYLIPQSYGPDYAIGAANCFDDEGTEALSSTRFLETLELMDCVATTDAGIDELPCT